MGLAFAGACSAFDGSLLDPRDAAPPAESRDGGLRQGSPSGGGGDGDGDDGNRDAAAHAEIDGGGAPTTGDGDAGTLAETGSMDGGAGSEGGTTDASDGGDGAMDDDGGSDPDPPCEPSAIEDYCAQIPALPSAPVIDGALDCGVVGRRIPTATWNGTAAEPVDHEAWLAVAHRSDGLYVHVNVRGQAPVVHPSVDPIYCGDVVELYVDADGVIDAAGNYDDPGTMQIIVAAPASEVDPDPHAERFVQGSTQGPWTDGDFAVVWRADGYSVETFIRAADLGLATWSPSASVGVDVAIGVSGASDDPELRCGRLLGQYFLRLGAGVAGCDSGEPWCSAGAFCLPTLE